MPRIPYQPADLAEPADLVAAIHARRGGSLLHLDRMLLHSPAYTRGWNGFLREVRTGLSVSPKLRELAICGVAVLNGAHYEFRHHAPEFLKAGGTTAQLEALPRFASLSHDTGLFDVAERAVIRLTIEMTREVEVSDDTFAAAQAAMVDHEKLVEIVGVIATYNMVSRFLVAFDIKPEDRL